jgi:uncharacterized protein (DUF2236 family)
VTTPIVLPWPLQSSLEAATRVLFEPGGRPSLDFSQPVGEAALVSPNSVSWRVFKNPLSLFIGGVTAVIMELAACARVYGSTRISVEIRSSGCAVQGSPPW